MGQWWNGENRRNSEIKLLHCDTVQSESHTKSLLAFGRWYDHILHTFNGCHQMGFFTSIYYILFKDDISIQIIQHLMSE